MDIGNLYKFNIKPKNSAINLVNFFNPNNAYLAELMTIFVFFNKQVFINQS